MELLKLTIRYIIAKNKTRADNKAPLFCRLTYNKKRKQFATGLFVNTKYWDSKKQLLKLPDKENHCLNTQLSLIKQKFNQAFLVLQVKEDAFDVDDVFLFYKEENINREQTLMEVFKMHNDNIFKLIGKEYTKSIYYI